MALSDFVPERREILVQGKPLFSVEGLSLEHLAILVRTHMPDLQSVVDIIVGADRPGSDLASNLSAMAIALAKDAPGLAANIVAVCSGEEVTEDLVRRAMKLPFPVKVHALVQIGELTFEEAGGVKKSVETLMVLFARMRAKAATESPKARSSAPTMVSAET